MAENSKIEWTDHTANFWWGKNIWGPAKTTDREPKKSVWSNAIKWNDEAKASGIRRKVFCMSMGDFFEDHPQVTEWRDEALDLISRCKYLDWQILTKRPENVNRMIEVSNSHSFSDADMWFYANSHVWIGTSVENQEEYDKRSKHLFQIPAAITFYSMEPLLGPIVMNENDPVSWVIVGGESGPNAHPMHPDWARSLRDQCVAAGIPYFFKQWGNWWPADQGQWIPCPSVDPFADDEFYNVGKKSAGRLLDGRTWDEFPAVGGE